MKRFDSCLKTKNKISGYILRSSAAALLFSCVVVAICSAIDLADHPPKFPAPQNNTAFGVNKYESAAPVAASAIRGNRTLTFQERVSYQRAIEEVYWRHRIWPKANPGPKPPLEKMMSQAQIEKKVEDYLRKSRALENYWQKPITPDQVQAEMERIATHTKQPEVLREIFAALGNDPFVIAECLARPVLAERSVTESYAHDGRLGNTKAIDAWAQTNIGVLSPLQEDEGCYHGVPVMKKGNDRSRLASIAWLKEPLRSWLTKAAAQVAVTMAAVRANYTLPVLASPSGGCTDDSWIATGLTNVPDARTGHTAVWTGSEMIVWGGGSASGAVNTGGRYNPSTDSWTATSTTGAPDARGGHTVVWTGSEMIVWGGNNANLLNTGGRYDPSTNSWTATSTTRAPAARQAHTAVWTGSEMIVWGGYDNVVGYSNTGGRYNPSMDSWTATSMNALNARVGHTAVCTGSEMIVWGGYFYDVSYHFFNTGERYNLSTDSWTATSTTSAPSARGGHTAVWTGSEMIVWGGAADSTGGRYNPGTDSWTATSTTGAPDARGGHTVVWTGTEMIVWGGVRSRPSAYFNSGGRYNLGTNSWTATSLTNVPDARSGHTAVWTGSEMIVWGGGFYVEPRSFLLNTGGRYCAATPSTTPTPTPTPTATATATPTPTPTPTLRPSPTPRPSATPRPRPTPASRP